MSSVRQAVEWIFGDIVNFFKFQDFKKNLKIGLSPVGKMYIVLLYYTMLGVVFIEQLSQNILNVNHKLLKHILHINRGFIILLSNSCCEFKLQHINISVEKTLPKI